MIEKKNLISNVPAASVFAVLATSVFAGTPALFAEQEIPAIVAPTNEPARYTTTQEMKIETRLTAFFLERAHILQKKIAEMDMPEVIENDCAALDATKSIFLQSDVDALKKRFAPSLADYITRGHLHAGFVIYSEFLKRLNERIDWIDSRLAAPKRFNIYSAGTLSLNRQKETWQPDIAAANDLWERRLTSEIVAELLGENKDETAEKTDSANVSEEKTEKKISDADIAVACEKLRERYKKLRTNLSLEPWEVEEIFLNALTAQYDPHTTFFSKQSMEEFEITMRNSLCGIGAVLSMVDGYCTIREIMPGSPVERSGKFSVGDRIVAVGETGKDELTDVVGMRLNRIVRMLRGKKGVPVRLLVESGNDHSRQLITLTRDEIKLTEQLASAQLFDVPEGDKTIPVGVITLPSFYGKDRSASTSFSTAEDVKELLGKLKKAGAKAIVLDLRRNGGGYLNEAIDLIELFVGPNVPALLTRGSEGSAETLVTGGSVVGVAKSIFNIQPEWTGPVIVLVSKLSASASEIVAGALQDNHRAIIVGDPQTHGKGSVQEVIPFSAYDPDQNASIKLTRSKWYSPSGNSIQIKGVSSDIITPSVYSVLPVGEGDLEKPLAWDFVPSALDENAKTPDWLSAPISPELVKILSENSKRRQAELPEFLTHNRTIAWLDEREKTKSLPVGLTERIALRDDDKAFAELVKKEFSTFKNENDFEKTEIKLDSAVEQQNESDADANLSAKKSGRTQSATAVPGLSNRAGDDEEWPEFDVLLRESVRIAADWVELISKEKSAEKSAPAPKISAAEKR